MSDGLLSGLRAIDLTDEKGFVCGQILASLGVDVIKIEKPGGDPGRNLPPFYHDIQNPENSLYWLAFNTDKRSITLDLEMDKGQDLLRKLVQNADFVLESFSPGYLDSLNLDYDALIQVNQRIIVTSITHFGQKGPYSHFKGSELIDSAMGGVLENTGYPGLPPVKESLDSCYYHAGASAALGTILAHYYREASGHGQHVDVSIQEAVASRTPFCLMTWLWDRHLIKRFGPKGQIGGRPTRWIWPCQDGYIFFWLHAGAWGAPSNNALSKWIDEEETENPLRQVEDWERLDIPSLSQQTFDAFETAIGNFFLKHTKKEITEEGLKRGVNAVVISNPVDVLENFQLAARNYWIELYHSEFGNTLTYPRQYFLSSETDNYVTRRAPGIGQDNKEIYGKELGLSATEMAALKEAGVI